MAASAVAFYLTPKYLAVMAGAQEWGKDPQTQWQLTVASLGVVCGIAHAGLLGAGLPALPRRAAPLP